jgi:hypothetical protein
MGKHQQKIIQPLAGEFLGWGDERIPHRYIKLATASGEQVVKVAKSLRPLIQEWQPGIWLTLVGQKQVNLTTGKIRIKVKQILTLPTLDDLSPSPNRLSTLAAIEALVAGDRESLEANTPTQIQIRVCQGSSCRRRGSDGICRAMQTYLDRNELTEQVEIKPVKCLHQCKAAPHAIVTQLTDGSQPEKTHYRQIEHYQVPVILDRVAASLDRNRHFPTTLPQPQPTKKWLGQIVASPINSIEDNLITKIGNYLQHQIGSTSTVI